MIKFFVILPILVLTACQVTPFEGELLPFGRKVLSAAEKSHIDTVRAAYPDFDIDIGFAVVDEAINPEYEPLISADLRARRGRMLVSEKSNILYALDTIKFVVNTEEFKTKVRERIGLWPADLTVSFNGYRTTKGQPYSVNRVLEVVSNARFRTIFTKRQIGIDVAAQGSILPDPTKKLYYLPNRDSVMSYRHQILLPNRDDLNGSEIIYTGTPENPQYWHPSYTYTGYFPGLLFHEIVHNMGFLGYFHAGFSRATADDLVYGLGDLVQELVEDSRFMSKYSSQMRAFRPYYSLLFSNYFSKDTTPENSDIYTTGFASSLRGVSDELVPEPIMEFVEQRNNREVHYCKHHKTYH